MLARINRRTFPTYWDDFFNDSFFHNVARFNGTTPAVNIVEDEKEYRIDLAVPGMSRKDFSIDLENDLLTISSEHKHENEEKKRRYMRREFGYNSFKRSFHLPESVNQEKIKASHKEGILTVSLPKRDETVQKTSKQIEIK